MSVKINEFQIENVKRIKAVQYEPSEKGLTIIGGRNNQGKTSVIDSIAWALGGNKFKPSKAQRDDSVIPPFLKITLSNGVVVEREGKNSTLKVIDPDGNKGGQALLDEFVEAFALNLPKFMEANNKEKADTLLQIIGVGDKLFELESSETQLYNQRRSIGQIAQQKAKYAAELPSYGDVPEEIVSASELIRQQQDILLQNAENQKKRSRAAQLANELEQLNKQLEELKGKIEATKSDLEIADTAAKDLIDQSTAELEENIRQIDVLNTKVRANQEKRKAEDDARDFQRQYDELTEKIDGVRYEKQSLLDSADLPLPELSVIDGDITYKGMKWDNMSGSDRLKVATAIIRKLNPKCGFVLMDKLEQMDRETLEEFGKWLEGEDLQVIATRVSTGDECSIIIEDGYDVNADKTKPKFKEGVF